MFLSWKAWLSNGVSVVNPINGLIETIKYGEIELRDKFIKEYTPFIINTMSKYLGVYVDSNKQDIFNVGLSAFNNAIEAYSINKSPSFISYSENLIRKYTLDYVKKNRMNFEEYPFSHFKEEYNIVFRDNEMDKKISFIENRFETRKDIKSFEQLVLTYNIKIDDLTKKKFFKKKTKINLLKIGVIVADNQKLFGKLEKDKTLPIEEIESQIDISRRKIKSNKKYITIVALILRSDLYTLKNYILSLLEEERQNEY